MYEVSILSIWTLTKYMYKFINITPHLKITHYVHMYKFALCICALIGYVQTYQYQNTAECNISDKIVYILVNFFYK